MVDDSRTLIYVLLRGQFSGSTPATVHARQIINESRRIIFFPVGFCFSRFVLLLFFAAMTCSTSVSSLFGVICYGGLRHIQAQLIMKHCLALAVTGFENALHYLSLLFLLEEQPNVVQFLKSVIMTKLANVLALIKQNTRLKFFLSRGFYSVEVPLSPESPCCSAGESAFSLNQGSDMNGGSHFGG